MSNKTYFGRRLADGTVAVFESCGSAATRLPWLNLYPVGSDLSTLYEHPEGIVIPLDDAVKIGLPLEEQATHTPGPWSVIALETGTDRDSWPRNAIATADFDEDAREGHILFRQSDYTCDSPFSTAEADARLIAAAPELLAACRRWATWAEQRSLPEVQGIACDTWAAIAQAEGRRQ